MPLPPYRAEDETGLLSAFARGFLRFAAVAPWVGFALAYAARTMPVLLGPAAFLSALLLAFIGSIAFAFAVRADLKRKTPWLRWCARSTYLALVAGIVILFRA